MRGLIKSCLAGSVGRRASFLTVAMASLAMLVGASSAGAMLFQKNFLPFATCPFNNPDVSECVVSTVTSGEFHLGSNTVPINKTITLQGGINRKTHGLEPATDGNTLSKTALTIPGGLLGIELLGDLTEVTATAELVGTVFLNTNNLGGKGGPSVSPLPLQVKLDNPLLGGQCIIGSASEPVSLNLTTGVTDPPPPNVPITGNPGNVAILAEGRVSAVTENTLVDNAFAAPGAKGCGILPLVIDPSVNLKAGLPAAAGKNTAIMNGGFLQADARIVKTEAEILLFGRCTKVEGVKEGKITVYNGKYSSANCVTEAVESLKPGKFEWTAGPGSHRKFTGAGELSTLETAGKTKVKCTLVSSAGEFTGLKTATVSLTFTGCESTSLGGSCKSSGAGPGEVRTSSLAGELGFIKDNEPLVPVVGLDLKPAAAASHVAQFECGGTPVTVDGGVIGTLTPHDKVFSSFTLKFAQARGGQKPESFEEGVKGTLTTTVGAGAGESSGITSKTLNGTEEPIEVKARAF